MYEVSGREHEGLLVEHFARRKWRVAGGEAHRLSEAGTHQMHEKLALVPSLERMPAKIHKVNFDSLLDVLRNTFEEVLLRLRLVKGSVNQVYAHHADRFLLEDVRRIPQIDMQHYVVRLSTGLLLKTQSNPTVSFVGSSIVACRDGIDKTKETSLRSASLVQLAEQLSPFAIQHDVEALSRYVT